MCMMQSGHLPKAVAIFCGRPCGVAALYLYEDNLEDISTLQSFTWWRMVFADSQQVNDASRFATVRTRKAQKMPARVRRMGHCLPDADLRHGYCPFFGLGCSPKSCFIIDGR